MKLIINDSNDYAISENTTDIRTYDTEHYNLLKSYENKTIGNRITHFRIDLAEQYCKYTNILDIGCGTGHFIRMYHNVVQCFVYGYDILQETVKWLKDNNMYIDPFNAIPDHICGITMFDVIEHLPDPSIILEKIRKNAYTIISVPIIRSLDNVKQWKHYRPKEHLHYWTREGFIKYMMNNGFECLEESDYETRAGREDIMTFVFQKVKV
jgi:2-polyprenyl-3-methyl-5-hydroxy-6-metoxy-1,4-benzoquinol methylase